MKDEHNLDKLFKQGLEETDTPFREADWLAMSEKLDQQDKKTTSPLWWSLLAGAAASIVIFFLFFNKPKTDNSAKTIDHQQPTMNAPASGKVDVPTSQRGKQQIVREQQFAQDYKSKAYTEIFPGKTDNYADKTDTVDRRLQAVENQVYINHDNTGPMVLLYPKPDQLALVALNTGKQQSSEKITQKLVTPERLSFTLLAAPDISSTGSSIGNKVSTNFGILVNYALNPKIGISTGVIYAKKVYNYNGMGVSTPSYVGTDWRVDADCKVLDLPINVDYRVFKKRSIGINVSAGLSSYIMLNEKYELTSGPARTVTNDEVTGNKHYLGIANFSVSVERKVSPRLSLGVQPFLKVPLTGIGKYEGNLSSAGVSLLLNIKSLDRH